VYINLLRVVDYLYEHHDKMYVLPGKNGALVYDEMLDEVVILWGDFSGSPRDNSAEARLALEKSHAWMN
jgi:hypothetical protein